MSARAISLSADRALDLGLLPKKAGAKRQGATARNSGRALEHAIERVNAEYHQRGEAAIERVPVPTDGFGKTLRITGPSTVDFTGTVHAAGRGYAQGIAFDAKVVTGVARYRIGVTHPDPKTIAKEKRQLAYLIDRRDRFGYLAGLVLYCHDLETLWVLTDLDALMRGEDVTVRTKSPAHGLIHHLPHVTAPLALAAAPRPGTRRPHLDFLSLFLPSIA